MEILAIAQLAQDDLDAATRAADIAQRNSGSVLGFGLVGLAAYRRGETEDAKAAFHKGYLAADDRNRSSPASSSWTSTGWWPADLLSSGSSARHGPA